MGWQVSLKKINYVYSPCINPSKKNMQFTNPNCTLNLTEDYLEYVYNPSFTYELSNKIKPNYESLRIEFAKIKRIESKGLSMARSAIIIGTIVAILGPIATIKSNEDSNISSASIIFLAVALFIIGTFAAYTGWKNSKLPKAKMKSVRVFHHVSKEEKLLGISESVIFVSDNDQEIQNVINAVQSKISSKV